jgi:hypothetical protein
VQRAAGDKLDWYYAHPQEAYAELIRRGAVDKLPAGLENALSVIGEARQFATDNNIAEVAVAEVAIPHEAGARDAEYRDLIDRSARGRLSAAQDARLLALAEARTAALSEGATPQEMAAHRRTLGLPQKPAGSEYEKLIAKSASQRLSAAEDQQLHELATARAIEAGLMDDPATVDNSPPASVPDSNNPGEGNEENV